MNRMYTIFEKIKFGLYTDPREKDLFRRDYLPPELFYPLAFKLLNLGCTHLLLDLLCKHAYIMDAEERELETEPDLDLSELNERMREWFKSLK